MGSNHRERDLPSIARLTKTLVGTKGITYLMFVSREAVASRVAKSLLENKLVKHKDTVYQYVNELQREDFLRVTRIEKKPGPPKIRTADLEPIFTTISFHLPISFTHETEDIIKLYEQRLGSVEKLSEGVCRMLVESELRLRARLNHSHREKLGILFGNMGGLLDYLPDFIGYSLTKEADQGGTIRSLSWPNSLWIFLSFSRAFLSHCLEIEKSGLYDYHRLYSLRNLLKVLRMHEKGEMSSSLYSKARRIIPRIEARDALMNIYIEKAHETGTLTERNIHEVASLAEDARDAYVCGTFSNLLFLASVGLKDPELAESVKALLDETRGLGYQ